MLLCDYILFWVCHYSQPVEVESLNAVALGLGHIYKRKIRTQKNAKKRSRIRRND